MCWPLPHPADIEHVQFVAPSSGDAAMLTLNPHQFANVLESLRKAGSTGGSDKRRTTRMEVQARITLATLTSDGPGKCFSALTRDVSMSGVGFFQHFPSELGSQFLACFPFGKGTLVLMCTTKFCRVMAEGMFGVGAEFTSLADEKTIKQFNDAHTSAVDRIRNNILG
jgi:hypothetical protein